VEQFFVMLKDHYGNKCAGALRAHLRQHYSVALHLIGGVGGLSGAPSAAVGASLVGARGGARDFDVHSAARAARAGGGRLAAGHSSAPEQPFDEHTDSSIHVAEADAEGQLAVQFCRRAAGEYEAVVAINSERLAPPLLCEVRAGAVSAPHCYVEGRGADEALAGEEARFTILAHDRFGNRRVRGRDKFSAWLTLNSAPKAHTAAAAVERAASAYGSRAHDASHGRLASRDAMSLGARTALTGVDLPGRVKVSITDCADGSYECVYRVAQLGGYLLHVEVDGERVEGSPFDVHVLPAYVGGDGQAREVSGRGLRAAVVGEPATFLLTPRDTRGHTLDPVAHVRSIRCAISQSTIHQSASASMGPSTRSHTSPLPFPVCVCVSTHRERPRTVHVPS
jgi:hypothetical protein